MPQNRSSTNSDEQAGGEKERAAHTEGTLLLERFDYNCGLRCCKFTWGACIAVALACVICSASDADCVQCAQLCSPCRRSEMPPEGDSGNLGLTIGRSEWVGVPWI